MLPMSAATMRGVYKAASSCLFMSAYSARQCSCAEWSCLFDMFISIAAQPQASRCCARRT